MTDPISGIAQGAAAHNLSGQKMQQQMATSARSFESVLQNGADHVNTALAGQPAPVSGAKLEQMRLDLMQRIDRLAPDASRMGALLPELIGSRTRLSLLKEAMSTMGRTPTGMDLRSRFAQVENEWYQVESIMKSNKDLSTGELLGLQARLYQVSQHVEVLSKVVDQAVNGVRTILNTNV